MEHGNTFVTEWDDFCSTAELFVLNYGTLGSSRVFNVSVTAYFFASTNWGMNPQAPTAGGCKLHSYLFSTSSYRTNKT